MFVTGAVQG